MRGFSPSVCCGLALLALAGCGAPPPPPAAPPAKTAAPLDELNRIVERYWDERISIENAVSPQVLADSLNIERRYLAELLSVPRDSLDAPSRLTFDIFRRRREAAIEGFTFPGELLPINPFGGMVQQVAAKAEDLAQHPAANGAEYAGWLKSLDEYIRWTQQAVANMREGLRRGYASPRAVIERMLPILERLGADDSTNVFYAPLRAFPASIKDPERSRLTRDITSTIAGKLLPANRALHDFLQHEYLPRARSGLALSELPLGSQWYSFRVKRATGTALSPDEIHRIGVAEVERLGPVRPKEAPAAAPAGGLVNAYQELQVQIQSALPNAFSEMPQAHLDIRAAEQLPQPAAALYYQRGGPAGVPPDVLYIRVKNANASPSIAGFLQHALPGEHFQAALQQERTGLPRFRRFGDERAFTEGWGLYAVSLGDSLGVFPDEAAEAGAVAAELQCAAALVVDTGLHAKNWTRGQAVDYLRVHLGLDDADVQSLIDWYAASPADALACMMGEMEFRALRARAKQLLGGRFDLREFHTEILRDGAMPLDILETKMKLWMDASK